ncbi:MAG: hypothetical protein U0586_17020, partial [Candidatus Brocadiaceae bacterium]
MEISAATKSPLLVGQASPLAIYDVNRGRLTYLVEFRGVLKNLQKKKFLQGNTINLYVFVALFEKRENFLFR